LSRNINDVFSPHGRTSAGLGRFFERFVAEEAKRRELSVLPGVEYAEFNCVAHLAG
jgi:hypothetical protein